MALIKCSECGREISDKASTCPGCGVPIVNTITPKINEPNSVTYNSTTDTFTGTMDLLVKLAMRAIREHDWTIKDVNENIGLITFKAGSWISWGVECSLNIVEMSPYNFQIAGTGRSLNIAGQLMFDIGGEAKNKVRKIIETMKKIVLRTNSVIKSPSGGELTIETIKKIITETDSSIKSQSENHREGYSDR